MAERFGGQFSPKGAKPAPGPAPQTPPRSGTRPNPNLAPPNMPVKTGIRASFMFVLPLLFLGPLFGGTPQHLVTSFIAAALMLGAAFFTREGIKAHQAFDARKVARRPALPRKLAGSALVGAALVAGAAVWANGLIFPLLFGLIGGALHLGSFGLDPLHDKGAEGIDPYQTDRVAKAVAEAEAYLQGMADAVLRTKDHQMEARVGSFAASARGLFRAIEDDPGDLTAARKYLSVYLMGARDATVKFADLYAQNRDAKAREDYEALLSELESTFAEKSKAFLANDHNDLEIEISVLRDRLKLEG
jgi:hypothetical protein